MAEAIARHYFGRSMYVQSAGIRKGEPSGFTIAVLEEIGIDAAKHKPRTLEELEEYEGLNFDLIITLSPEAHHAALELTRTVAADVEYWPTQDPTLVTGSREQMLDAYRNVRDGLLYRIRTAAQPKDQRPRARRIDRVPRPARSPASSDPRQRHRDDSATATLAMADGPPSIMRGRVVATMIEPGRARIPRSTRGVMLHAGHQHDASDAAEIGCEHHRGDRQDRAPRAGDEVSSALIRSTCRRRRPPGRPAIMNR